MSFKLSSLRFGPVGWSLAIFGGVAFILAMIGPSWISGIPASILKVGILCGITALLDNGPLRGFDTIQQIRQGNTAYAIVYGSLVLAVGIIIATA